VVSGHPNVPARMVTVGKCTESSRDLMVFLEDSLDRARELKSICRCFCDLVTLWMKHNHCWHGAHGEWRTIYGYIDKLDLIFELFC